MLDNLLKGRVLLFNKEILIKGWGLVIMVWCKSIVDSNTMKEQILKLKSQGKSYNEIRKELGCSKSTISYHLGRGRKERTVAATKARRLKERREIKLRHGGRCSKCGYSKCLAALQFHHIEPNNKKFGITEALRLSRLKYSREEIEKESEKCILLCANCHLELHYPEQMGG